MKGIVAILSLSFAAAGFCLVIGVGGFKFSRPTPAEKSKPEKYEPKPAVRCDVYRCEK